MPRQHQSLFPIDTERGKNSRPLKQQLAILVGLGYTIALIVSLIPNN
jgi:hypothetical protein